MADGTGNLREIQSAKVPRTTEQRAEHSLAIALQDLKQGPKAVVFDFDDTLAPQNPATGRALAATGQAIANEVDGEVDASKFVTDARQYARQLWEAGPAFSYCREIGISHGEGLVGGFADPSGENRQLQRLRDWVPDFRQEVWSQTLAAQGVHDPELAQRAAEVFIEERWRSYGAFEDAVPVLEELREQDFRLAILTNGAPDLQHEKIDRSGLGPYVDQIVISGEFGVGKPNPKIFRHVLESLGSSPEQAMMVGDSPPRDILGAYQSGMFPVLIDRESVGFDPKYRAMLTAHINNLWDLMPLLERGGSKHEE